MSFLMLHKAQSSDSFFDHIQKVWLQKYIQKQLYSTSRFSVDNGILSYICQILKYWI
jgi:hypothetical protein